jgi:chemotaxis signal transduction protein
VAEREAVSLSAATGTGGALAMPGSLEFALFEVGSQRIGVPSANVVQAIAYPAALTHLPRAGRALAGVFTHRGQVVPLLDLQRWMLPQAVDAGEGAGVAVDAATASAGGTGASQQVLILKAADKLMAVVVHSVKGLLRVPPGAVRRIHQDEDAQEFFHSVLLVEDQQTLISLLDPQRLALLAQVWASAPIAAATQPASGEDAGQTETYAMVRLGTTLLALPASSVGEVLARPLLQKMGGLSSDFLGMTRWRGHDVPVLELAQMLALPEAPAGDAAWLLVLHLGLRTLAFYVDEIRAVRTLQANSLQPGTSLSDAMQPYCRGSCLLPDGERVYWLRPEALLDASPLSNVARSAVAEKAVGPLRLGYQAAAGGAALVVFKSRQLWAASMGMMREIVTLPKDFQRVPDAASAMLGSIEWRGQALALWDLRQALHAQPSALSADARIIVTQCGAHTVGLLVESVVALIPAHAGSRARFSANGAVVEMVTVGSGAQQASYQLMDLSRLALFAPA